MAKLPKRKIIGNRKQPSNRGRLSGMAKRNYGGKKESNFEFSLAAHEEAVARKSDSKENPNNDISKATISEKRLLDKLYQAGA